MKAVFLWAALASISLGSIAEAKTSLVDCTKKLKDDPKILKSELKMVTLAPAGSQWAKEFQAWADDVLMESDCQVALKWYWNGGGGGDELRMVADLRQGQKHGAAMTSVGLGEVYRDVLVFQLPGLFENWPALDAARTEHKAFFEAEFEKRGFTIVGWGDVGAAKLMSTGFEVKTPTDLKGHAAFQANGDVVSPALYAKVGLQGRTMGIGEVGTHLGKDIDVINIAPYAAEQLQIASKVTNMTAMTTAFLIGAVIIKKEKLDSMTPEHRDLVLRVGRTHADTLTKTIRTQDAAAFTRMKTSKKIYTPAAAEVTLWKEAFKSARTSLRGAPFTPEVFDRVVK